MPGPAQRRLLFADLGALGLVGLALLLHAHFALVDARMAVDLGHYYRGAMEAARAASLDGSVRWGFAEPGYAWLLAALWGWLGPSQALFEAVEGLWLGCLGLGLWQAGRAGGGPRGGLVAASAVLLFPLFPEGARTHWIHHPEVSLGVLGLGLAMQLPRRAWAGALVGAVLALGATVRPSAAVWLALPALAWVIRVGPRSWRAWSPVLAGLALGTAAHAPILLSYLELRVSNRGANAAAVGSILPLLPVQTGLLPGLLALGLGGWGLARARGREPWLVAGVSLAWLAGGLVVLVVSAAGPSNVPTAFAGLALLAGLGAGALPAGWGRYGAVLLGLLVLLGPVTQLLPVLGVLHPATGFSGHDHPQNFLVPRSMGLSAERLVSAAREACPPDRQPRSMPAQGPPCRVIASSGLVHPSWEDDGGLGFFLAGIDGVQVYPAPGLVDQRPFQAAVQSACTGPVPDPSGRFPEAAGVFEDWVQRMDTVTEVQGNGCTLRWYALREP